MEKTPERTRAEATGKIFKDQLLTVSDLLDFKDQLIADFRKILKEQVGQPGKKWLKAFEVRKLLNISAGKLQYLRDRGEIPYTKLGGVTYYDQEKIQNVMESPKK